MKISPPFILREQYTRFILDLLERTTLGTNGARYQHLNTKEIIDDLEKPLFLSLERNEKAIANITLCRRGTNWYVRYFAFDQVFQSKNAKQKKKRSGLKKQINDFFTAAIEEGNSCYAYIDPKNTRSREMCESFGFEKIGNLKTYSFSRIKAQDSPNLIEVDNFAGRFKNELFYSDFTPKRTKCYALKDKDGQMIAGARIQHANWRIERLPGKAGKVLVKVLPFIPVIRRFLKPEDYRFIVPDMVFAEKSEDLNTLFEAILSRENEKLILWWIDEKNPLNLFDTNIRWGIFKYLLGNPKVSVYLKSKEKKTLTDDQIIFVNGMDLI